MTPPLPITPFVRNVFLDTQVFKTNNFNFSAKPFEVLKERVEDGRATVCITEIVNREVRSRMRRELVESQLWFNKIGKEGRILLSAQGGPFYGLPRKLDTNAMYASLEEAFEQFLHEASVEIIDCSHVPVAGLLDSYFNLLPPFKEGEKRKEFPDAISIAAVAARFADDGVHVVSGDGDLASAVQAHHHLHHYERLEDFLQAELSDHEDVSWIANALENQSGEIGDAVSDSFDDGYFYLNDQDGEVESIDVTNVDVHESVLISATDEEAEVSVRCTVSFTADVSYEDPSMTIHDEGEKFSFGTIEETIDRQETGSFSVRCSLDRVSKAVSDFECTSSESRGIDAVQYDDLQ